MLQEDRDYLISECLKENIELNERQAEQFSLYFDLLIDWNTRINLTAITEPREVIRKHFIDSLLISQIPDFSISGRAADIGTGAGFPGIPLAIMYPEAAFVLIDSLGKRVNFLEECKKQLKLDNVTAVKARAEEAGRKDEFRESFDLVVSRAVASLPLLCEYCLPLVKEGGFFAAYKSQKADEEVKNAEKAIEVLGGKLIDVYRKTLEGDDRTILMLKKVLPCPSQYPRKPGIPAKRPLT